MDYVETHGLHEPHQAELNGYQNVRAGCFSPYPYQRHLDQRFGSVTESQTGANSNRNELRAFYTEHLGGLTLCGNYTFSRCLDELERRPAGIRDCRLGITVPGELSRQYASSGYDIRHNASVYGIYQIPFHSTRRLLRQVLGGWAFSETGFLHSAFHPAC